MKTININNLRVKASLGRIKVKKRNPATKVVKAGAILPTTLPAVAIAVKPR